jgi:hypothetical protein
LFGYFVVPFGFRRRLLFLLVAFHWALSRRFAVDSSADEPDFMIALARNSFIL